MLKFATKLFRSSKPSCNSRQRCRRPVANTMFLVDCSHSMGSPIKAPNGRLLSRLDAAVESMLLLAQHKVENCPQDLLGCVGFGSKAFVALPLTRPNHPKIPGRLRGLRLCGSTDMEAGLRLGLKLLAQRSGRFLRNMVLLSDGYPDRRDNLEGLARMAKSQRVNLHTIGVGNRNDYDEQLLRRLSSLTHRGRFQHVASLQELASSLRRVA